MTYSKAKQFTIYDFSYSMQIVEYIGPIITFPILSAFGFFLNALVVLVIRHKPNKVKHFKNNRIFTYVLLNSSFNAIECLISSLTLMNECLGYNAIYCSSIQRNTYVQVFKIVIVEYLGESLKTCSIFMLVAFSIERYIQTAECKRKLALKFQNMNINHFLAVTTMFALASSVPKLFEYYLSGEQKSNVEAPFLNLGIMMKRTWFQVLFVGHYIINDLVLSLVNLFFDILLVFAIRDNLRKKERVAKETTSSSSKSDLDKKKKEKRKAERRTNKLIIYQMILYILCRFPEIVFSSHFFFVDLTPDGDYMTFCITFSFCSFIKNNIQYIYIVSYLFNVYFYYKFNKQFRNGAKDYFHSKSPSRT